MLEQERQGRLVHSAIFTVDEQAQADQVCVRVCARAQLRRVRCFLREVHGAGGAPGKRRRWLIEGV